MNIISEKIWKILLSRKFWLIFQVSIFFLLFIMYTIHLSRFNSPLNVSTDAEIPNITLAIVYILLGVIVGFPWGISTFFDVSSSPGLVYFFFGSIVYYLIFIWFVSNIKDKNIYRIMAIILLVFMLWSFFGGGVLIGFGLPL
ncbi:MAG: hypothetical protein AAB678_00675 [Patescibacteria group bacterium]